VTLVVLTPREFATAAGVGMARFVESSERGHDHASTYQRGYLERMAQEVVGACGEMALCKAVGRFWSPSVGTFHALADMGSNVEVRSTARADGCLIVRDNDADDRWFYLVTGEPPTMTVRGSILGRAAKRPEWERNPHGHRRAWFVPAAALRPLVVTGGVAASGRPA